MDNCRPITHRPTASVRGISVAFRLVTVAPGFYARVG